MNTGLGKAPRFLFRVMDQDQYTRMSESQQELSERAHIRRVCCFRRSTCLLFFYVILYGLYIVAGSIVFSYLETGREREYKQRLIDIKKLFLRKFPCVEEDAFENLISEIGNANNHGLLATNRSLEHDYNWSPGQAILFSTTVITTIGYGHVTPLTTWGKLLCIFYATLGIPLTLVLLSSCVERLMNPANRLLAFFFSKLGSLYQPLTIRLVHLVFIIILVFIFFIFVPAAIFTSIEPDWNYLDSVYYCFISLTTIGLGDYIPGDSANQYGRALYKICITVYLLLGLVFVTLFLAVSYDIPQLNFGVFFHLQSDVQTKDEEEKKLKQGVESQRKYTSENALQSSDSSPALDGSAFMKE